MNIVMTIITDIDIHYLHEIEDPQIIRNVGIQSDESEDELEIATKKLRLLS